MAPLESTGGIDRSSTVSPLMARYASAISAVLLTEIRIASPPVAPDKSRARDFGTSPVESTSAIQGARIRTRSCLRRGSVSDSMLRLHAGIRDLANAAKSTSRRKTWARLRPMGAARSELRGDELGRLDLDVLADLAVLPVAHVEKLGDRDAGELVDVLDEFLLQDLAHGGGVAMGAAERLGDHLVHDAAPDEVVGRQLQEFRGERRLRAVAPQDRRASLGRDDREVRVLEDREPVGDADAERAAAAALPDDDADDRRLEARHLEQVARDDGRLAALLGADA